MLWNLHTQLWAYQIFGRRPGPSLRVEGTLRLFNRSWIFEIQNSSVETLGAIVPKRTILDSEIFLENIKL
jgi:hypothetical protein